MEKAEATYQYSEEAHGNGMFFYTDCCKNRIYSINTDPMLYHNKLCPKCFWQGKTTVLYLRGTEDGIRVFKNKYSVNAESEG